MNEFNLDMPTGPTLTTEAENDQNLRLTAYRASESYWFTDQTRAADAGPGDVLRTAAAIENYFRTGKVEFPTADGGRDAFGNTFGPQIGM